MIPLELYRLKLKTGDYIMTECGQRLSAFTIVIAFISYSSYGMVPTPGNSSDSSHM